MIKDGGLMLSACGLIMPLLVSGIGAFVLYNNFVIFTTVVMAIVGLAILIIIATDPE
jgi:hypothetical protein